VNKNQGNHVVVVGQGYVGLPLSMAALKSHYRVTGIDLDVRRIEKLKLGKSIVEDISDELITQGITSGYYNPTHNYRDAANFNIAIITVPTPLKGQDPDLSYIKSSAESIAHWLKKGSLVILESTTYPGTTEELLTPILEQGSGLIAGIDFYVGYSPERIDPGNKQWNLLNTPKVVSGINAESLKKVSEFYESLGIPIVPVSGTREAEMAKLLENTFRHVNIALVNELAMFSKHLGVDIWESIEAASTKPFGFMKFTPGPGVGGHCLPVDPSYLAWAIQSKTGADFKFVSLANVVNDSMPQFVVARAYEILERLDVPLEVARVLLIGLAYKQGTGDMREAPSIPISNLLINKGVEVYALDNYVLDHNWPSSIIRVDENSFEQFDLSILITNHADQSIEWTIAQSKVVLDTRNCLEGTNIEKL